MRRVPEYIARKQWWLCFALLTIAATNWILPCALSQFVGSKARLTLGAITILGGTVGVVVFMVWAARVRQRVRSAHARICPKCSYDLRGSPYDAGTCPECGQDYTSRSLEQAWYWFRRNV